MKNITQKFFDMFSTWLMVILFISAAPFANAQVTPDMTITNFQNAEGTPITNAYPGNVIFAIVEGNIDFDFKTTVARYALVNQEYINSQGQNGVNFPISVVTVADKTTYKEIKIKATVPHNILKAEYALHNLRVLCVTTGTTIDYGEFAISNLNVIDSYNEDDLYLTGGEKNWNGSNNYLRFYQAGPRHFTTPEFNIHTTTSSTLSYEIRRTNTATPPAGSEIYFEYSINGQTWVKFKTIKLDMGTTWPASTIEHNVVAGMVSTNTQFRFRQAEDTYTANTHPWEIQNFVINVPPSNNNFDQSDVSTFTINQPIYTIALTAAGPFEIGSNVSVTISDVFGKFPDNTKFEKILYNLDQSPNDYMHFGIQTNAPANAGTFNVPLPFILNDDLRIRLRAEGPEGYIYESTTNVFNSQTVSVAINSITFTEPIEDAGGKATSPGKGITANYTINGTYVTPGIQISLEYKMGPEWYTLKSIAPNSSGTGTISGTLPYMTLDQSLPIRVILVNTTSLGYRNQVINRNAPSNEVGPYTVVEGSRFAFNVYGEMLESQNVFMEYSTDAGNTWKVFGTKAYTAGTKGFLSHYAVNFYDVVDSDLIPITGSVKFRINAENTDAVNAKILGHRLEQPYKMPIIQAQQSIRIINPSVTFSDMVVVNQESLTENDDFHYNTQYSIKYTTRGLWPADTYFAFAFVRNNKYMVLAESKLQDTRTLTFTVPTKEYLEEYFDVTLTANENFTVKTFAYSRNQEFGGYNNLRLYLQAQQITSNDIIERSGTSAPNNLIFNGNDERYAITRAYDLSNMAGPVYLNFYYQAAITNATLQTLPKVQASIDNGVTYSNIEISEESVSGGSYTSINRLEKTGGWYLYKIELPSQYLTAETHFRWIQMVNNGDWEVYSYGNSNDPAITGTNNELTFYDKYPASQSITFVTEAINCSDYSNSMDEYTWTLVDETLDPLLDPVAVAGEEFTFAFEYAGPSEPTFPVGTEFYFLLRNNDFDNTSVVNPKTNEPVIFGPYQNVNDTIKQIVLMPDFVETGTYSISAVASYSDDETDCSWPDKIIKNNLFIEGTQAHDALNLTLNTPENGDNFKPKEAFDLNYSTLGSWPTSVKFAAVIKATINSNGNERYKVLGESTATGLSKLIANIKMISNPWWYEDLTDPSLSDYISSYQLGIVAYQGNEFVLQDNVYGPLTSDDFIVIQGQANNYAVDNWIEEEGNRKLLTRAFDLTGLNKASLQFSYWADNITVSSSTLPQLLVSIDGGVTFIPLAVDSEYGISGFLDNNVWGKSYTVEIPQEFVTSATHFMWKQQVNGGLNKDKWQISTVNVSAGSSSIYEGMQNYVNINLTWPRLNNYSWLLTEVNGIEPTIFNGNTFEYNWSLNDDPSTGLPLDALPEGVEVEFFLWNAGDYVIDPSTDKVISLGTVNATGKFSATIPFLTDRDTYGVMAIATLNEEVYDKAIVKNINIFNNAIRATLVETNPVVFAGDRIEVKGTIENATNISNYNDIWFNLILDDGSNKWLLDTQKGLNENFVVDLHPSIKGNSVQYYIEATTVNPMGTAGQPINSGGGLVLDSYDLDGAFTPDFIGGKEFTLDSWGLIQQIYTNITNNNNWDLTKQSAIKFQLKIEKELAELTNDQKLVLAYSTDGGVTFTNIASYPDARFENPLLFDNEATSDWFNEYIPIPEAAKTKATILRWRVEESKGYVQIKNIEITPFEDFLEAPLQPIFNSFPINEQRIDLVANNLTTCPDGTIEFTYNIRGRFSAQSMFTLTSFPSLLTIDSKAVKFTGITQGTGVISLNLGLLDNSISGTNVRFKLNAEEFDFDENSFVVNGKWTELGVEIIPSVEDFTPDIWAQTLGNTEYYSCAVEERVVVLNTIKEYFAYQLRNVNTSDLIGEAVFVDTKNDNLMDKSTYPYYNPAGGFLGEGSLEIAIGAISELTTVEVLITSHNAENNLTCQTLVVNNQAIFNTRNLAIQYKWTGSEIGAGYWKDVTGNEDFTICEGSTDLSFRLYDYTEEATIFGDINWYRNNIETPVAGAILNNYAATGEYFVVYKHNNCSDYTSVKVQINVVEVPVKPIITFNGSQEICEGGFATLTTYNSYSFYRWYKNGFKIPNATSNTIEVYENGNYEVEVSNRQFNPNVPVCSKWSDIFPVSLNIHVRPIIPNSFVLVDYVLCEPGVAQVQLNIVEDNVRYQLYNWLTKQPLGQAVLGGNQGTITLTSDMLTEDTKLGIMAWRNGNVMCDPVYSTISKEVTVHNLYIDVNGNMLIASIQNASSYQWYRNGKMITFGGNSDKLSIYDNAVYKVVVVTYDGCTIESSIGNGPIKEDVDEVTTTILSLFPNPARDNITVSFTNADDDNVRIRILNISGEVVFDKKVEKVYSKLNYDIPISMFSNGAYIVHVIGKQEVKVQQFIKF